jgi:hypothetical protein
MNTTNKSKLGLGARFCLIAFAMLGVVIYRHYAPASLGNSPEHDGISLTRSLGAGISGGVGAMIALGLVRLVEKIRGKP